MNSTDVIKVNKVFNSFEELFKQIQINDGMTISFHHHLREGDNVMFQVLKSIQKIGVKGVTLACTSLMNTHDFIADMLGDGTVSKIQTSGLKGKLACMALSGEMPEPVIFRSHGSRARAVSDGELKVDIAFIAASAADIFGNANALDGPSAFGSLGYGVWEAKNAKKDSYSNRLSFSEYFKRYKYKSVLYRCRYDRSVHRQYSRSQSGLPKGKR